MDNTTAIVSVNSSDFNSKNYGKPEVSQELITTKELAESLGVNIKTIQRMAERLFDNNVEKVSNGGRPTMMFNKAQATAIKIELQNHSKVARNGFDTMTVSNDLEMLVLQKKLSDYQSMRIEQLTAELEQAKPKLEIFDTICNSESLKSVDTVASNLGYGKNKFFALMRAMNIFHYSAKDSKGRKYNLPYQEYIDRGYFTTKEEPYGDGNLYTKIYVTGKGEIWLTKKLNETN